MWKMVKDAPNHVPVNMIGSAHTSLEILKDSDVPIFLVVIITPYSLQLILYHNCECTGILLSTFWLEANTICVWP